MEGTRRNFGKVLADFESRLQGADFVAIDTELTGVELEGKPDTFDESADIRLDKCCRIAEKYTLIQLGLTVVGRGRESAEQSCFTCASYNLFAFPYVGPEHGSWDVSFSCQASALQFNSTHRVNFNTWIGDGVSYLSREDERRLFGSNGNGSLNGAHGEKVGLLRLWKVLCASRLPFDLTSATAQRYGRKNEDELAH